MDESLAEFPVRSLILIIFIHRNIEEIGYFETEI